MNRLCVHTITTKPLSVEECFASIRRAAWPELPFGGMRSRDVIFPVLKRRPLDAGLDIVSLCRGGFFPATTDAARQSAIDDNLRAKLNKPPPSVHAHCVGRRARVARAKPGGGKPEANHRWNWFGAGRSRHAGVKFAHRAAASSLRRPPHAVNTMRQAHEIL